ncbi:MAG: SsrA-binding protein SmpB [Deltaproteobacteria bacterium]|nr:SsrA-binding protein SmpB [Deltaproteobacteria bacterium]
MSEAIVNRKAWHDYHIEETVEAGIVLEGSEVKSLRAGRSQLKDGFARVHGGEIYLHNIHISPYAPAGGGGHDPNRTRKLLLHRREIERLDGKQRRQGYTLIPLRLYFNRQGFAKIEIGLAKGKAEHDKRDTLRRREANREMARAIKKRV